MIRVGTALIIVLEVITSVTLPSAPNAPCIGKQDDYTHCKKSLDEIIRKRRDILATVVFGSDMTSTHVWKGFETMYARDLEVRHDVYRCILDSVLMYT